MSILDGFQMPPNSYIMQMQGNRLAAIRRHFQQYQGTITAFSGGIDSTLVLFLSRRFLGREKAIGVISNSASLKEKEYRFAVDFCLENDIILETIATPELNDPDYTSNPANRCYFCKTHLYRLLAQVRKRYPDYTLLNGTNKDDFSDYRPGLQAADEYGIVSPLALLGCTKAEVRRLAKHLGIPIWKKPASPCLSSRIPYGNVVTSHKLKQIEQAENLLNHYGFNEVRVRHYGETCSLEVPLTEIAQLRQKFETLRPFLKKIGFKACSISEEGLVSGKLNRDLNLANDELQY
ncbi:MAG: ATP-dependent sacrificial sulfur transferase LarE [Bacteroidota bacterium]